MTGKQALRERVWDALEASGEARFPFPPHDRIPNFAGADEAVALLADLDEWQAADAVKANPDAPQLPVRRRALHEGKTVYMAVPRLRDEECFLRLDSARIDPADYDAAPALSNVGDYADQVGPDAVEPIDLVVSGSVAVTADGARVGKGEGYSDLEYAVLREFGLVDDETTVVTTVHELQVVDGETPSASPANGGAVSDVDVESHDVPMDYVVTPERTIATESPHPMPAGIDWSLLDDERVEEIPVLRRMQS
jgi:5-formyltetrahydrofolate cyclo-ligase